MATLSLTTLLPLPVYLVTDKILAVRPATLDGKVLGLLANWRASAAPMLNALSTLLAERYRLQAAVMEQPLIEPPLSNDNVLASVLDKLEDLARRVDVVITASADCGGGSTWCSYVSSALEERGVPTVVIATDTFTGFTRRMASTQGYPGIVIAETPNPMREIDPEALRVRGATMLSAVIDGLTVQPTATRRQQVSSMHTAGSGVQV